MIRSIVRGLLAHKMNAHMREVIVGSLLAFAFKVGGTVLALGFNVLLARRLGADGTGVYFLSLSITTVAAVIGSVGLNNTLLRFVATHATRSEWQQVNAVHALAIKIVCLAAGAISIVGFVAATWIADNVFGKIALAEPLRWMSLTILPTALFNLYAQSLKGVKRLKDAMFVQGVGVPLVGVILIWPLAGAYDVLGAVWAYAAGTMLMALFGFVAWNRAMVPVGRTTVRYEFNAVWQSGKPLLIAALASEVVLPYLPLFLLGVWGSSGDVGIYGMASRIAALISFLLVTSNHVIAPKFAELYAQKDIEQMGAVARRSASLMTLVAMPVIALLIFAGDRVMGLFGPSFIPGWSILIVLVTGQAVNLATGSVGYLLMMTGNEHAFKNLTIISSLILVLLSLVFIPLMSALGAAIATTVAVTFLNLGAVVVARQRTGIWCFASIGSLRSRAKK